MKTLDEARNAVMEARLELRKFNEDLTLEQSTLIAVGDQTTVEVLGLKTTQKVLLESIIKAEQELRDAKKA
jgi:ketopantoate hydroxymethyltransferase